MATQHNLTQSHPFDYGNLSTPARTYNYSYLTGYASQFIFNRLTSATVTPAGGSAITLGTNSYDGSPYPTCTGIGGLRVSDAQSMHDTAYDINFTHRGNLTQTTGLIGSNKQCYAYDTDIAYVIIHELLHVAVGMGYSVSPDWHNLDGGSMAFEQQNNDLIVNNCGVGTIWP
jgi:hypothetical protein